MTAMSLNRWFAPYRAAYRNSAARRFLTWWGRELAGFLPARVQAWFIEYRDAVQVLRTDSGWQVMRSGKTSVEPQIIALDSGPEELRAAIERLLKMGENSCDLVVLLPRTQLLERRLHLPMAAEENLAQVIVFELDRQTPFRVDQVHYDYRIAKRDLVNKQIQVDVIMVPRSRAEVSITPLVASGLALDAMDVVNANGQRLGFNLLPAAARAQRKNSAARLNWILAAVVFVLLCIVMNQSLEARSKALESLQSEVDKISLEARKTDELSRQLVDAIDGANFLASRKKDHPVAVNILRELTDLLPNHTSLTRLSVNNGEVQIQGNSSEAAELIAILQQAKTVENPAMQGAITPNAQTQKQQFLIQAKVRLVKAEALHAAAPKS